MRAVRVKKQTLIYRGKVIRLFKEVLRVGQREIVRETIKHPGAVVILAVLDDGRIVFVRQYRRAVERVLLELPAGTLEPGEPKARCARRELEEETGWRAAKLTRLCSFYAAPGFVSEQMTLFLAQGLSRARQHPEPDEMLKPVALSLKSALKQVDTGAICDAKTIIGVLFFAKKLRLDDPAT